jgi:hypothetical protein
LTRPSWLTHSARKINIAGPRMQLARREEIALINAWIAEHGVTRCESRFAIGIPGALTSREEARRLAMLAPLKFDREAHLERLRRLWLTLHCRRRCEVAS